MKICLLNAPPLKHLGIVGQIYPPLGILYLASYTQKYLNDVHFIAIDGYKLSDFEKLRKKILSVEPDILGVSFTTQASTGAYKIINMIKEERSRVFVIAGGAHPTIFPGEVLKESRTDLVCMGEGERTFLEFVQAYESGDIEERKRKIRGLAYLSNGELIQNEYMPLIKDLDEIPFPDRTLLNITDYPGYHYKLRGKDTSYVSTRGCPYNCIYCSNPVWKLQKPWYRMRSPQNIVNEIEHVVKTYGVTEFYDQTDEFNGNLPWAKSVCDELINRKLGIAWKVQMRADNFDDELATKMSSSGCWLGFFGVETGNDETSTGVGKHITTEQVDKAFQIMKRHGMKAFALLMAFNVWEEGGKLRYESMEDTEKTLLFVERLIREKKVDLISWSLTTPYPGSQLYDVALRHNLISEEIMGKWENFDSSGNFVMNLPGVTGRDWMKIYKRGKVLQTRLLFSSRTFNMRSIPIYFSKGLKVVKRMIFN